MALTPSNTGWSPPTLPEVRERVVQIMQAEIAVDVPLSSSSAYGRIAETLAKLHWLALSAMNRVYLDAFVRSASGSALDRRVGGIGFTRLPAQAATGTGAFFGTAATSVSAGALIASDAANQGRTAEVTTGGTLTAGTLQGVLIDDDTDGTYRLTIDGENLDFAASGNTILEIAQGMETAAAANTKGAQVFYFGYGDSADDDRYLAIFLPSALTCSVSSPASGLTLLAGVALPVTETSIVEGFLPTQMNASPSIPGVDVALQVGSYEAVVGVALPSITGGTAGRLLETDAALRARYLGAVGADAANAPRMTLAVSGVLDVTSVQVYENETDTTDGDGRPAHSVEVVVLGGVSANILPVIAANLASGIQSYGTGDSDTIDGKSVALTRPTEKYLWIEITATSGEGYDSTGDNEATMEAAVLAYLSELDSPGYLRPGLDVYLSRIASAAVASVPGIDTISVEIDLTATSGGPPSYAAANETVGVREIAIAAAARISATIS